jgi:AcrR family transcriptional regulator
MVQLEAPTGRGSASSAVRLRLLEAAETCLLRDGYSALSTRAVAEAASTPLSQIHYHFGSKQGLVLALLEHQNQKLLRRQAATFGRDAPLSDRWLQACDHLEEDLRSGYVRVLQEIIAAGYSDSEVAQAARKVLDGWFVLLTELAYEGAATLRVQSALSGPEIACLIGAAFLGAESVILIGMDVPIRSALRGIGAVLRDLEASRTEGGPHVG